MTIGSPNCSRDGTGGALQSEWASGCSAWAVSSPWLPSLFPSSSEQPGSRDFQVYGSLLSLKAAVPLQVSGKQGGVVLRLGTFQTHPNYGAQFNFVS